MPYSDRVEEGKKSGRAKKNVENKRFVEKKVKKVFYEAGQMNPEVRNSL